jgi:cytochrome oxidase Cu insertion factor (SCO1/SenC/PrrC family)
MKTLHTLAAAAAAAALSLASVPGLADSKQPAPKAEPIRTTAAVGKPAPDFKLKDLTGKEVSLSSFKGKVVVLEWINPGCPFVKKSHTVGSLVDAARRHAKSGVVWLAINSGGAGKQGADPAMNAEAARTWALDHPILRDEAGAVGKAYGATNTPHMYVIDKKGVLVYAGAIDNSPDAEGKSPEGGKLIRYVDAALEDVAAGKPVRTPTSKAYGCSVKYAS